MVWRAFLALAGILIVVGGSRHPRGASNAEMLAHPGWVPAHVLITAGFAAMLIAILLWRRAVAAPERSRRWTRWAIAGTALQLAETVFHTAAVVDAEAAVGLESLVSADAPILSIHMILAIVIYPIFGLAMIGWIVATARDRTLGSVWIAWVGVLGALAHGLSAPLVLVAGIREAGILFPMLMLLAIWAVLTAVWPVRAKAAPEASAAAG